MRWINEMNRLAAEKVPFLFILDFELRNPVIKTLKEINPDDILYSFNKFSNSNESKYDFEPGLIEAVKPSADAFKEKFARVQQEIQAGNTYLLNLCFETPVKLMKDLKSIFFMSHAPYKLWMNHQFVVFSPESFVKIHNGLISTYPMKGTLEKTDEDSPAKLLSDIKESAEHATITDLLRNDLARVADKIRVKRYRYIDEIKTQDKIILQVSSEITGMVKPEFMDRPGDLFSEILPAGSVTGAPKEKTVEIIKDTENFQRGYYTGVFGIFDGKNLDSAVMIRFIEERKGEFFYKSGGGITFMSDAKKEYDEIIQKIYVPVY